MSTKFHGLTDVGRRRNHNEDYFIADESTGVFIVCDGMGGHSAGEIASKLCAQTILEEIKSKKDEIDKYLVNPNIKGRKRMKNILEECVYLANYTVLKEAETHSDNKGMGTTLVMILIAADNAFIAHVGDSRSYLIRSNEIHQMTDDHSFVNQMLKEGILTTDQAKNHPQKNALTMAIGQAEMVQPEILHVELMDGDRFLLCTDGLSNHITRAQMLAYFGDNKNLDPLCQTLIGHANEKGGTDNITALVIETSFEGEERTATQVVEQKISVLQPISLFKKLNYQELTKILDIIETVPYEKNDFVIKQDENSEDMFVILKGSVRVEKDGIHIATLKQGEYFGEMGLIDHRPRSASCLADSNCQLLALNRTKLLNAIKKENRMGLKIFWALLQKLNRRLRQDDQTIAQLKSQHMEVAGKTTIAFKLDGPEE